MPPGPGVPPPAPLALTRCFLPSRKNKPGSWLPCPPFPRWLLGTPGLDLGPGLSGVGMAELVGCKVDPGVPGRMGVPDLPPLPFLPSPYRIASSNNMNKSESDQEDNDDINDNDWSYGSEKKGGECGGGSGCQLGWGSLAPHEPGGDRPLRPLNPGQCLQWVAGWEQPSAGVPGEGSVLAEGWGVGWRRLRPLGRNPPEKVKVVPSLSLPVAKKRKSDKVRGLGVPGGGLGGWGGTVHPPTPPLSLQNPNSPRRSKSLKHKNGEGAGRGRGRGGEGRGLGRGLSAVRGGAGPLWWAGLARQQGAHGGGASGRDPPSPPLTPLIPPSPPLSSRRDRWEPRSLQGEPRVGGDGTRPLLHPRDSPGPGPRRP